MDNLKKSFKSLKWYEWLMAVAMIFIAARAMVLAFGTGAESGGNPAWLTAINFVSAVCGVFCIFFCAKAQVSNFAFGLINTLVYAVYLWYWKIYGTFCLEMLFYLPMNVASWIAWSKHRDNVEPEKTKSKKLSLSQNAEVLGVVCIIAVAVHYVLERIGGNVAWLDSFTVAIGIVATYLEMRRYLEQYVWWLITDVIAVAMYIVRFDPVYTV